MEAIKSQVSAAFAVAFSRTFIKQMLWVLGFWVFTIIMIIVNIEFLKTNYPNPARPDDLLLDLIPESESFVFIGDIFTSGLFAITLLYFCVWQGGIREFPKLFFLLAVMYLMRSFVINLTPLAQIQPPSENFPEEHFIAQTFYHGMYFSGHTASAFIQAFFFKGYKNQWLLYVLSTGAALALVASHSHYTIDIVGGFFAAYFIVNFDWMTIVPRFIREIPWMPWNAAEGDAQKPKAVVA